MSILLLPSCDVSWPNSIKSDMHVIVLLAARKYPAGTGKKDSAIVLSPILPLPQPFWERNVESKFRLEGENFSAEKQDVAPFWTLGSLSIRHNLKETRPH